MVQDGALNVLKPWPGLDAELFDQLSPRPLVAVEGLDLPTGAGEGDHQLFVQPPSERVIVHQRLELGNARDVAAQTEIGLDAGLERRPPHILQPRDLSLREALI